jgi:hypothetical protein
MGKGGGGRAGGGKKLMYKSWEAEAGGWVGWEARKKEKATASFERIKKG